MSYRHLQDHCKEISWLDHATKMLGCASIVMMPAGGGPGRAETVSALRKATHTLRVAPELGDLIDRAGAESLDAWQRANVAEIHRR